ncbi:MAG: RNA 2',3'-cyclic phosphodiesterase [Caulobacteraceae bacterium]
MIRLFAAVAIPEDIAAGLAPRQKGVLGARWRPAESLHLTLRFFGAVREDRADDLDLELAQVRSGAFELTLEGVGAFGEGSDLHALWAGVARSEPLERLAARCEAAARRAGLPGETRTYKPHVTLAYLKDVDPAPVGAWVQSHNLLKSPPFQVRRFGLYSSWAGEGGVIYRLERSYPLA